MIIKASERGGARNLANHLANTKDNEHVELYEVRGLVGQSLHAALLEIDGVCQGTQSQKPFFSTSFNPPIGENVTYDQFIDAFDRLEKKLGLTDQPRAVVFHEKEGRRHAHVVWSRVDIENMKVINMSHFKNKCTDISRQLYLEHGWDMPKGLIDKRERDSFQLSNGEWQFLKRSNIDPKEIKLLCQDAWKHSDNLHSFKYALEERNLFLARGDRRGFVVMDHTSKVYSLTRHGGISTKDLKNRFGNPDQLSTVEGTKNKIRSTYNAEILSRISTLKKKHQKEMQPLQEKKALLVTIQRAERRELSDQQRVKRNITAKSGKDRFRRGVMGLFDKVTGREKRVRLINRKETSKLKRKQVESRELMIFRQNMERTDLQKSFKKIRDKQRQERVHLAKRIYEFRQIQDKDQKPEWNKSASKAFDKTAEKSKPQPQDKATADKITRQRPKRTRKRGRILE